VLLGVSSLRLSAVDGVPSAIQANRSRFVDRVAWLQCACGRSRYAARMSLWLIAGICRVWSLRRRFVELPFIQGVPLLSRCCLARCRSRIWSAAHPSLIFGLRSRHIGGIGWSGGALRLRGRLCVRRAASRYNRRECPKFVLDHCILCRSLLYPPHGPQTWCVQSPSRGSKSLQACSQRRGGAHHSGGKQAAHGRIVSLLLALRKPLVCRGSVKVAQ